MNWYEASHGAHCGSRTFPINCRDCRMRVFFFTCNHGSRVLFEELGPPWPLHACRLIRMKALQDSFRKHLADGTINIRFPRDYETRVRSARTRTAVKPFAREIRRMDPYNGLKTQEVGVVRELLRVDLFDRLGVPETALTIAMLGDLARGQVTQATVHTEAIGDEDSSSFTFLVSGETTPLEFGAVVSGELEGRAVGDALFWECRSAELLS